MDIKTALQAARDAELDLVEIVPDAQPPVAKVMDYRNQDKVKVTIRFRGREMAHQQIGLQQLEKVIADITDIGNVEQAPKVEGRQMGMLLGPTKKK